MNGIEYDTTYPNELKDHMTETEWSDAIGRVNEVARERGDGGGARRCGCWVACLGMLGLLGFLASLPLSISSMTKASAGKRPLPGSNPGRPSPREH